MGFESNRFFIIDEQTVRIRLVDGDRISAIIISNPSVDFSFAGLRRRINIIH